MKRIALYSVIFRIPYAQALQDNIFGKSEGALLPQIAPAIEMLMDAVSKEEVTAEEIKTLYCHATELVHCP